MSMLKRGKNGRFRPKSDTDRKVRSIRATDSTWKLLGDMASAQNMTRADLMDHLVQAGLLDDLQRPGSLQDRTLHVALLSAKIPPILPLTSQISLASDLALLRELIQKLEPMHQFAQMLDSMQQLVQQLEPLQDLAQRLEPILRQQEH